MEPLLNEKDKGSNHGYGAAVGMSLNYNDGQNSDGSGGEDNGAATSLSKDSNVSIQDIRK